MFLLKKLFGDANPVSLLKIPFGNANANNYIEDIKTLKFYYDKVYSNKEELGVYIIRVAPNVFVYNSSAGSMLSGSLGMGTDLAVAGIGGNNDALAQELGGEAKFMGKNNYYQFRVRKKFRKKEMIVILEQLCSMLQSEYRDVTIEFNKKLPGIYTYLK